VKLWSTTHQWTELGYTCGGMESYDHNTGHTTRIALNPMYKSHWPMVLAHEVGHSKTNTALDRRMRHIPYYEWLCEVKAWLWALKHLPPNEIDCAYLESCLKSYISDRDRQQQTRDLANLLCIAKARKEGRL